MCDIPNFKARIAFLIIFSLCYAFLELILIGYFSCWFPLFMWSLYFFPLPIVNSWCSFNDMQTISDLVSLLRQTEI